MALSDPFVVTVNGVPFNLARIVAGNMTAAYRSPDGLLLFDVTHKVTRGNSGSQLGGASRVNTGIHYEVRKPKEDNPSDFHSLHLRTVIDRPEVASLGWTEAELIQHMTAFSGIIGLPANVTKFYGLQS